jgi:cytochrome oxidase Cu insertion factor (SCO1/SenC/PrrC family)
MKKPMSILVRTLAILVAALAGLFVWQAARLSPDLELGVAVADVSLTTADGEALPLSSLRGKIVLLDFWGST